MDEKEEAQPKMLSPSIINETVRKLRFTGYLLIAVEVQRSLISTFAQG